MEHVRARAELFDAQVLGSVDLAVSALHRIAKNALWVRTLAERLEAGGGSDARVVQDSAAIRELGEEVEEVSRSILEELRETPHLRVSRRTCIARQIESVVAKIRLVSASPIAVVVDEAAAELESGLWLGFALTHLVENAVDATARGGSVAVQASVSDGLCRIAVRDSGSGMTDSVRAECRRAGFSGPDSRGTGLGLTTAGRLVEAAEGVLRVESAAGVGTTAELVFPASEVT